MKKRRREKAVLAGLAVSLALMVIFPLTGHAAGDGSFTKHYEGSLFKTTEKGLFSLEMIVKGKELTTGVNAVDIIVHDRNDRDVVGAELTITPWMPEHGHGVYEKPVVKERGGGLYSVDNIIVIMSGRWELRVKVRSGDVEDGAIFVFPAVKVSSEAGHKHMATRAPARSDIDTSRTQMSEKKLFKVTYVPDREQIPVNKLHAWKLKVETTGGGLPERMEITLTGDMPEHGHGLPTEPKVTREPGSGQYLVEGLKFSMPGWWMLTFRIRSGAGEDSVTFNLYLE